MYERKCYVIGIMSALNASSMPQGLQDFMLRMIKVSVQVLRRLKDDEAKALKKAAKKEMKNEESDEEDEED